MLHKYSTIGLAIFFISFMNTGYTQLCLFNDEFEDLGLNNSWMVYQGNLFTSNLSEGRLKIDINGAECGNNCPWFHAQSAGFIYKEITGDFEVVAAVESIIASGPNAGNDIDNDTQLGGLMARNGQSTTENYVFNVVGTRFDIPSIETKSTINDNSGTIEHFDLLETKAELRMTRVGNTFTMYSRAIGNTDWILRSSFTRNDLPDTLQVGLIAYAFESYPEDLLLEVDYIRFSEIPKINQWIGGDGMWNDATKWSLQIVPNNQHSVVIDNLESQSIQILSEENFTCLHLDVRKNLTDFIIGGALSVLAMDCK